MVESRQQRKTGHFKTTRGMKIIFLGFLTATVRADWWEGRKQARWDIMEGKNAAIPPTLPELERLLDEAHSDHDNKGNGQWNPFYWGNLNHQIDVLSGKVNDLKAQEAAKKAAEEQARRKAEEQANRDRAAGLFGNPDKDMMSAEEKAKLQDLTKEQLEQLKNALHEMGLDKIVDKQEMIKQCDEKRAHALAAVDHVHGDCVGAQGWYIAGSSTANAVPDEFGGPAAAAAADLGLIALYCHDCQSRYNDALDFKELLNFEEFFESVQDKLHGEGSICERIDEKEWHYVKEAIIKTCELVETRTLALIKKRVVEGAVRRTMGADAFRAAEEHAAGEYWHDAFESVAERQAAEAAERALIERFGGEVTAEGARMLEREAAKRAAEAAWGWIPVLGSAANAAIGAFMMRSSCCEVNDQFKDEYTEGANQFFDCAKEFMAQSDLDSSFKSMCAMLTADIDEALRNKH